MLITNRTSKLPIGYFDKEETAQGNIHSRVNCETNTYSVGMIQLIEPSTTYREAKDLLRNEDYGHQYIVVVIKYIQIKPLRIQTSEHNKIVLGFSKVCSIETNIQQNQHGRSFKTGTWHYLVTMLYMYRKYILL